MTQKQLAKKNEISLSYLTKIEAINCNKSCSLYLLVDTANDLNVEIRIFF